MQNLRKMEKLHKEFRCIHNYYVVKSETNIKKNKHNENRIITLFIFFIYLFVSLHLFFVFYIVSNQKKE